MRLSILAASVLALVLVSCGETTDPSNPCTGVRTVTVSNDAAPVIGWAPACGAAWVTVQDLTAPGQPFVWTLIDTDAWIDPPLTYGVLPAGHQSSIVHVGPEALVTGHDYTVTIYRQQTENETAPVAAGTTTFTR